LLPLTVRTRNSRRHANAGEGMQYNKRFNYVSGPDLLEGDTAARKFLTASPRTSHDQRAATPISSQLEAFPSPISLREAGTNPVNGRELRAAFMRAYKRMAARDRHTGG
jgi:hypothetical protein